MRVQWFQPVLYRVCNTQTVLQHFRHVCTGALVLLVNATMRAFYSVNAVAGWLMLPYLAWTTFALVLNWAIWRKNRLSGDTMSGASWSAFPRQVDNPSRDDW